jgi:hypothetical protein
MAYGDFKSMKTYCNLINTLTSSEVMSNIENPEQILKRYLGTQSLEIKRFKYDTVLHNSRK